MVEKPDKAEKPEEEITDNPTALTIFDAVDEKQRQEAIKSLLTGKTPEKYIQERPARGGGIAKYVNTYYMTRQISLVTGFRWSSECLKEEFRPNKENPTEIGALMKVTVLDSNDIEISHTSWGQKDVARYNKDDAKGNYKKGDLISLFDDLKAAYSDGIKKCLSYFGVANDIYGNRDYEAYAEELADPKRQFNKYVEDKGLSYGEQVFPALGIKSFSEITDFEDALKKLKEKFES